MSKRSPQSHVTQDSWRPGRSCGQEILCQPISRLSNNEAEGARAGWRSQMDVGRCGNVPIKHEERFPAGNESGAIGPSLWCDEVESTGKYVLFPPNKIRGISGTPSLLHSEESWVLFKSNARPGGRCWGGTCSLCRGQGGGCSSESGSVSLVAGLLSGLRLLRSVTWAACYFLPRIYQTRALTTWQPIHL